MGKKIFTLKMDKDRNFRPKSSSLKAKYDLRGKNLKFTTGESEGKYMSDPIPKRMILDCTLRDGGYVNNWEFDREQVFRVIDGLYEAGVRYIEVGIVGQGGVAGKSTKFADFSQMEPLLAHRKPDCHYAVMLNQAEASQYQFPPRTEKTVDLIRIAYFKSEYLEAMEQAAELKALGYDVFLQAMATFLYTGEELEAMLNKVNEVKPAAFYMVDSFSTMYADDVREMGKFVISRLSEDIVFGFHAHNNLQMAYSNAMTFFELETKRPLIADSCIYGMGRGAGNVPTELMMEYLNKKWGGTYQIMNVLNVLQKEIKPIFQKQHWGYSPEYYLTASKGINSVYGWYLANRGVTDLNALNAILDLIPADVRYKLSKEAVERAEKCFGAED